MQGLHDQPLERYKFMLMGWISHKLYNRAYEAFAEMIGWEVGLQRVGSPSVGEQDKRMSVFKSLLRWYIHTVMC
jgi:hypothetical protein